MVFSSMVFLWIFLPAVLAITFLCPKKWTNVLLVFASLLFYAWGEPGYILLMLFSVTINYVSGLAVAGSSSGRKKLSLFLCISSNLLILGYFKYFNFLVQSVGSAISFFCGASSLNVREIALPIGISFYTFQALSYVIDVYRGEAKAQKNFLHLLLYISLFPQLVAGPIVKYHDIETQIKQRTVNVDKMASGIQIFICGLGKKVLLANTFAVTVDKIYENGFSEVSGPVLWLTALLYMLQIYFDFSGYSDMAIGLGRMLGFEFMENFNLPYCSKSVKEFWRRWHISLSSWFRDYVYIPLGGNRKGGFRTYVNLLVVFFLTGLWHGAGWSFILWGLYHGLFLVMERAFLGSVLARLKPVAGRIYTLFVVFFGWIFFRAETMAEAASFIKNMFLPHDSVIRLASVLDRKLLAALVFGLLLCGPGQALYRRIPGIRQGTSDISLPGIMCCMAILWLSIMLLVNNTYNPFIYFRF